MQQLTRSSLNCINNTCPCCHDPTQAQLCHSPLSVCLWHVRPADPLPAAARSAWPHAALRAHSGQYARGYPRPLPCTECSFCPPSLCLSRLSHDPLGPRRHHPGPELGCSPHPCSASSSSLFHFSLSGETASVHPLSLWPTGLLPDLSVGSVFHLPLDSTVLWDPNTFILLFLSLDFSTCLPLVFST